MSNKRRLMYCALAAVLLLSCLAIYNRCTGKPVVVDVKRDTVVVYDTVPDIMPKAKDSVITRYVTRYLPVVRHDTENVAHGNFSVDSVNFSVRIPQDSVLVEVPITSKHYGNEQYDAYISGYEPNLDSIFVYQKTELVTETVTKTINPKRKPWGLGFHVGYGYDFNSKTAAPFVGVGLSYDIISF